MRAERRGSLNEVFWLSLMEVTRFFDDALCFTPSAIAGLNVVVTSVCVKTTL